VDNVLVLHEEQRFVKEELPGHTLEVSFRLFNAALDSQ